MLTSAGVGSEKLGDEGMIEGQGVAMTGKASLGATAPSGVLVGVSPLDAPGFDGIGRKEAIAGAPSLHVLVVDDDAAVRKACCDVVERTGYAAMGAETVADRKSVV